MRVRAASRFRAERRDAVVQRLARASRPRQSSCRGVPNDIASSTCDAPASTTRSIDRDPLYLAPRFGLLGQTHRQHAVLERRIDLVGIDVHADRDDALERAFPALAIQ